MDDMDRRIRALAAEGFSDRAIAREVGLSRTAVRKRKAKLPAIVDDADADWSDDDLDAGELALLAAEPVPDPVPPFRWVGMERVCLPGRKGDEPTWTVEARFVDGTGRSVSELDIYRADFGQRLRAPPTPSISPAATARSSPWTVRNAKTARNSTGTCYG